MLEAILIRPKFVQAFLNNVGGLWIVQLHLLPLVDHRFECRKRIAKGRGFLCRQFLLKGVGHLRHNPMMLSEVTIRKPRNWRPEFSWKLQVRPTPHHLTWICEAPQTGCSIESYQLPTQYLEPFLPLNIALTGRRRRPRSIINNVDDHRVITSRRSSKSLSWRLFNTSEKKWRRKEDDRICTRVCKNITNRNQIKHIPDERWHEVWQWDHDQLHP